MTAIRLSVIVCTANLQMIGAQLRQSINHTSDGGDPKHSMKASEDFLRVVL